MNCDQLRAGYGKLAPNGGLLRTGAKIRKHFFHHRYKFWGSLRFQIAAAGALGFVTAQGVVFRSGEVAIVPVG